MEVHLAKRVAHCWVTHTSTSPSQLRSNFWRTASRIFLYFPGYEAPVCFSQGPGTSRSWLVFQCFGRGKAVYNRLHSRLGPPNCICDPFEWPGLVMEPNDKFSFAYCSFLTLSPHFDSACDCRTMFRQRLSVEMSEPDTSEPELRAQCH